MAKRPCLDCGTPTTGTRCTLHARAADRARGTRQQRGYNADHDALRKRWAPLVAAGTVRCARCGDLIGPTEPWALDHTDDRTGYLGPSHRDRCNAAAGGRKG